MKLIWCALAASLALGCSDASVVAGTEKGEESPLPGKDDSLRKPTEHGDLTFGVEAKAALTAEERYHSWTFTLTAEATVTFEVAPYADNLDTVMYLHGRQADDELWGNYLERNDDHGEALWSRIETTLAAGHYRVLVKGYKDAIRGGFGLNPTCAGDGCPEVEQGDAPATLPAETVFTAACTTRLMNVLSSPVEAVRSATVLYARDRGSLAGVERLAADYYRSYWVDQVGWGWDEHGEDDPDGPELELFTVDQGAGGAVVSVAFAYGDEVTVSFVFDGEGRLVTLHHSEQSPRVAWYCAAEDEAVAEYPGEHCVGALLDHAPHETDAVVETEIETTAGAGEERTPMLAAAIEAFVDDEALSDEATIEGVVTEWDAAVGGKGARITLRAHGAQTRTYELGESGHGSTWVFLSTTGDATRFVCDESW